MTLRQVYYQLVARQVLENTRPAYTGLSTNLVEARKTGVIPWPWMEDRTRQPRKVAMWTRLDRFLSGVIAAYRRNIWLDQPRTIEVWLEKDALSGIFEAVLDPYGVTLNVGRGYDGWDSLHNASERYGTGEHTTILYFGDYDPSGVDMFRSLRDRLEFFECHPEVVVVALLREDIERYSPPPDFTKATDTRAAAFVATHGDIAVELDALPMAVLQARIVEAVESRMDMAALERTRARERRERNRLQRLVSPAARPTRR